MATSSVGDGSTAADGFALLIETQQRLLADMAAAAPDEATRLEGEQYLARVLGSAIQNQLPFPSSPPAGFRYNQLPMAGANPDCRMGQFLMNADDTYLITGTRGEADRLTIGLYTPSPEAGLELDGYLSVDEGCVDEDGSFSVKVLPASRGAVSGEGGPYLVRGESTRLLFTREYYRVPSRAQAQISVSVLPEVPQAADNSARGSSSGGRSSDGISNSRISNSADSVASEAVAPQVGPFVLAAHQFGAVFSQFLNWSNGFARTPNQMTVMPAELDEAVRGDPDTRYFSGYFDLTENEYLEIEIPAIGCSYWMIQATNHWLEPIGDASRNDLTAEPDADGVVRIRVSPHALEGKNVLYTQGRMRGALLYRSIDAAETVTPSAQVRNVAITG